MPITHSCSVYNFLNELVTVLETLIYNLQRFYLLVKGGEVNNYSHTLILQDLTTVTESSTNTSSGDRAWYRSQYRLQSLVPVPVPDCNGGSGANISPGRDLIPTINTYLSLHHQR